MLKKDVVKQVVTDINAESNLDETGFKLDLILVGSVSIELQLTSTDNKALSVPITIYGLGMDQCDESEIKFRLAKRVADELISLDPGEYLDPAKVICVINSVSAGDDAGNTQWVDVALKDGKLQIDRPLAFDHYDIIQRALQYLTTDFNSVKLPRIITLLPHELTLNQLKTLYSQIDSKYTDINNSNLYRLNKKYLQQTSDYKSGEVGRPERIYVYRDKDVTKFN